MSKRVIIIGAGISGLSTGIYSAINGFETEIIEMHTVAGGQCTAWDRKGYRFDYCLQWLVGTSSGVFNDIWKETNVLNENTEVLDHEIHSKTYDSNNNEFIIYPNIDKWEKYLLEYAPEDYATISRMCKDMRKSTLLEPFGTAPELRSIIDYLKVVPKMFPLLNIVRKFGKLTCKEYFDQLHLKNEKLKYFLYHLYGERDFSALAFIFMLGWFHKKNAGYILGGSYPLAQRMLQKFESLGGKITFGKKVEKIIIEDNVTSGIFLADGSKLEADYVISATDGFNTIYNMLEGKYLTSQLKEAYSKWKLFSPIVQVSIGVNQVIYDISPTKNYLGDVKLGSQTHQNGISVMNYSHDKTMAPNGKTTIIVRYETPWEFWENIEREAYKNEKLAIEKDIVPFIEQIYPGISANIEVIDIATPKTDVRFTGVKNGAYEGFLPSRDNMMKSIKMTLPKLHNFYMIGQWLYPGGGLPPSAQSGKFAIQLICKKEKVTFQTKK
jgi:phytoene dehydrogenase-like protein